MSEIPHDIKDNEIRVISSENSGKASQLDKEPSKKHRLIVVGSIAAALICIVAIYYFIYKFDSKDDSNTLELVANETVLEPTFEDAVVPDTTIYEQIEVGYVSLTDTVIGSMPLSIFKPTNLSPTLEIGSDVLNDSTVRFVVQAADVRGDNGGIVGAYVNKGELISKGQAKSGYCAIIGGKMNIGVAEATPLLEQALETNGYFFRQYPLVVANQIIENKPKGKSLRKALAELDGAPVVVMSRKGMTFHDFSQSLVDLGVANAIYLVGGAGYGFAIDSDGRKIEFGSLRKDRLPSTNYIVWR